MTSPAARLVRLRRGAHPAHVLVLAAVVWGLVALFAETRPVAFLDDSALHEQMVRFATLQWRAGDLPLQSWYPFLGLGSPQFLHYQSLPAMITGAVGVLVGPNTAYVWSLYLLLALWPLSVYLGARLMGLDRWAAGLAAACSPFLLSPIGVGYEERAYLWIGFGVWTQLWASMTLPLAWGFTWRVITEGRFRAAAVVTVALTVAFHYETGYLALIPIVLWPLAAGPTPRRLLRAGLIALGVALCAAWVVVPVFHYGDYAATNEILRGGPLENGYGADTVLHWLVTGAMLDHGRLPVVTILAAVGLVLAFVRSPGSARERALLLMLVAALLLSFGRATFGSLVDVVPGSHDVFFRRFMMGAQLVLLLLAGLGGAALARGWWGLVRAPWERERPTALARPSAGRVLAGVVSLLAVAVLLAPAWSELDRLNDDNAADISYQRSADRDQGAELGRLLAVIKRRGGGRTYAGSPTNWGTNLLVGAVPVYKYLAAEDVDEVGFTLRTASLMTDPEYYFNDSSPGQYALFGIHYLILPVAMRPPVSAERVLRDGPYALWSVSDGGYIHVGTLVGTLSANRTDVGDRTLQYLRSALPQDSAYLRIAWDAPRVIDPPARVATPTVPGRVLSESDHLDSGRVEATVTMRRSGIAVLSASYDPGWQVTVDGRAAPTLMVSPALTAVRLPRGTSRIAFRYVGAVSYDYLIPLALLVVVGLFAGEAVTRRRFRAET